MNDLRIALRTLRRSPGFAAALAAALALVPAFVGARLLRPFLSDVGPADLLIYCVAAALLLAVAALAAWLPAHRAARIEPTEALRHE